MTKRDCLLPIISLLLVPLFTSAATATLFLGSRGVAVSALQQQLVALKYLPATSATGYFGIVTRAAVRKFQCERMKICSGAPTTNGYGAAGPKTRTALSAATTISGSTMPATSTYAQSSYSTTIAPPPASGTVIPPPPSQSSCTLASPATQTQTVSCPAGQTGSITQTRTSSCAASAAAPTWSDWQDTTNTCTSQITTTAVWRVAEITFTSSKTYGDAFLDVSMDATFTGPGGIIIKRPAFWDGGNIWKVRFAPTKAGTWSYVTTNNDTSDTGLHGKSGSISAVAYAGSLPLYLHGFVRSQPGHNLVYDDGTPFFWWSMDTTLIPDFAHVNDSNKTNWAPPVVHPNSQMYGIIDRAVQQKFNTLTAQLFYIYNSSGLNQHMVDTKFKAQYDPFFEYASSQGLSVLIQLPAHDYPNYRDHGDKKLVRYISARYGAYPVMYATTEPDIPDADLGYPQSTWLAPLNQIYAYLASIDVDGYRHPFGVWFSNTGVKKFANNPPTVYLDKPWANFIITQCGNMTGVDGPNEQGQQPISIYSFYYHNYPSLPMVEAGGCNWVKIRTNIPDSRQEYNAWRAVLSGSSGFGYGAEGIWDAVYNAGDASNCCQGWFTGISWKDAIDTPAGEYMKNIKNYIDNMPVAWYDTRPLYGEWVDLYNNPNAVIPIDLSQDWRAVARATSDFGFEMIYIPYSNQRSGYTGYAVGLKQASYTGSWYSAFDGSTNVISTNLRPQNGVLPIPQIPNNGPWIFTLNAGNPIPDTTNDNGCHVQLPNGCPKDALYAAMGFDNKTFVDNIPSSDGGQCRLRSSVWYQYCGLSGSQSANTFFVEGGVPTVGEITNSAGSSHLRFINGTWVQSQD